MPTETYRAAGCSGKQTFSSWPLAERVARQQRRKRGGNANPYRCQFCGRVHVGTSVVESNRDHRRRQQARRKIEKRWEVEW